MENNRFIEMEKGVFIIIYFIEYQRYNEMVQCGTGTIGLFHMVGLERTYIKVRFFPSV